MILLLASEQPDGFELGARDDDEEVLVVAPALVDRLRYWTSDDDRARNAAARRLDDCVMSLRRRGLRARGYVADADPLQALDDAVRLFGPHEIVVTVQARGRANWRARDLVRRAERRLGRPVRHALA